MPQYIYKAKKGPVEIVEGQIEADSQGQAVEELTAMGLVPVRVVEADSSAGDKTADSSSQDKTLYLFSRRARIKSQDIDIFTRQLASLVKSGVPVLRALSLISQQKENNALSKVARALEDKVRSGSMLSAAIGQYPKVFNNLYLNMVKAGEKSGALDEVLYNLAQYREKEQEIRRKIAAALVYPLFMLVVGLATVFIMLSFFLPKFISLFENMRQTLPLSTRILIATSKFMADNWYWFLIVLFFVIAVLGRLKQGTRKKFLFDLVKLRLPLVKRFIKDAEVAKFSRTLSLLIRNGISVCDSLDSATDILDNDELRGRLKQARQQIINQGSSLSNSLKNIDIFPVFAVDIIAVGEEGGKLESSLRDIANVYEREVEQAIKIITTLLEPALILIIGSIVGFIVFAMLLPIFNIGMVVR